MNSDAVFAPSRGGRAPHFDDEDDDSEREAGHGFPDYFYSTDPLPFKVRNDLCAKEENGIRLRWTKYLSDTEDDDTDDEEDKPAKASGGQLQPYNDNDDDLIDCDDVEESFDIFYTETGKLITSFYVPAALLPAIIGPKGSKLKELQFSTQTTIRVPPIGKTGEVIITGTNERFVASARNQVMMTILTKREKIESTHFISIPMRSHEIRENFEKFKDKILNDRDCEGIRDAYFQKPDKLHLTIVMLTFLDETEIQQAKQVLKSFNHNKLENILPRKKYRIQLSGIEIMNDDPTAVDVLYGKVSLKDQEDSASFQNLADEIAEVFAQHGFVRRMFDEIKLHVTLMNSLFAKTDFEKRPTFDAKEILNKHSNFYFGTCTFKTIELSVRFTTAENGYYKSILTVPITKH